MNNLIKQTLEKIKKEKITPIPRWHFALKRSFFWMITALSIVLGSFAFSFVLLQINTTDWFLYRFIGGGFLTLLVYSLPYFWIVLMIIFVAVAYYHFIHTKTGYRYKSFIIVLISLLLSLFLGSLIYWFGISERIDDGFQKIPYLKMINHMKRNVWIAPQRGLLAGEILEIESGKRIILMDFVDRKWQVDSLHAYWRIKDEPKLGLLIKILGKKIDDDNFKAYEIRPWKSNLMLHPVMTRMMENGL